MCVCIYIHIYIYIYRRLQPAHADPRQRLRVHRRQRDRVVGLHERDEEHRLPVLHAQHQLPEGRLLLLLLLV